MKRNHVSIIGDQVRLGHTLTLNCDNCLHRADVDMTALVEANGYSYPLQGIVDRAVCKECGRRDVSDTLGSLPKPVRQSTRLVHGRPGIPAGPSSEFRRP